MKRVIQRLKRFKKIVPMLRRLKSGVELSLRLVRRPRSLIFHSSGKALARSLRSNGGSDLIIGRLAQVKSGMVPDLKLYQNAIFYPLGPGEKTDHTGGLIDGSTMTLIREAIHFNGEYVQELPAEFDNTTFNNELIEIKGPVIYGGILFYKFGHFLLESIGRLWAYDQLKDLDPWIIFHLTWREPDYLAKKNFVYMVLEGFKIPHKKILFTDKPALISNVIVPAQKYGYTYCLNPDATFLKFMKGFSFPETTPAEFANADKIYVSRSKIPFNSGKVIGEYIFEDYVSSNGYKIFFPERYNLYQQLSVYNKAKKIIFCDGSALHGCILLPDLKAEVCVIARRKDARWDCEAITDQFKGYGKKVTWIDAVKSQYQFGLESWNAISVIDWYKVSEELRVTNFVNDVMNGFDEHGYRRLVRTELSGFIRSIQNQDRFLDFIEELKEKVN